MKNYRNDPVRRRRSPLSTLLIVAAVIIVGLLAFAWVRGGSAPQKQVEIAIPADQLGR